jgi:hypothetical protein
MEGRGKQWHEVSRFGACEAACTVLPQASPIAPRTVAGRHAQKAAGSSSLLLGVIRHGFWMPWRRGNALDCISRWTAILVHTDALAACTLVDSLLAQPFSGDWTIRIAMRHGSSPVHRLSFFRFFFDQWSSVS